MPDVVSLLAGAWKSLPFEPFRDGVDIHWLRRFADDGPGVALLRYQPGAAVPRHRHQGVETVLVLAGQQSDEAGDYGEGRFLINPAGSEHAVWSRPGCVVLIHWQRPVTMLKETTP
jgi:anti-sigma factor ChrR (cupin superfamily)